MSAQLLAAILALALGAASCSRAPLTAPSVQEARGPVGSATGSTTETDEVVITVAPGADPYLIASDYGALVVDVTNGVSVLRPTGGEAADVLCRRISGDARVATVEQNAVLVPAEARQRSFAFDDGYGTADAYQQQPAAEAINLYAAHYASRGSDVPVAILDTGADPTHPALAGHIAGGWDFIGNDADFGDTHDGVDSNADGVVDGAYGHGTHIAGIVSLVAPQARLLIVRVLDSDGRGDVRSVAAGIRWATQHGARVINMSLGMLQSSPAINSAIVQAAGEGVLLVASAGNWGAETPQEFPARSSDVVAVAAVDAENQPASFTSYGSFVDLCAPGIAVRSAYPGGLYRLWSGTSMSTAFVSGTAALLLANHPSWQPAAVRARIGAWSHALVNASATLSSKLGSGALDAGAALGPDLPAGDADRTPASSPVRR
ncbi:MAG: S8 family serine peptidase [Candidatus Eisenbacteria bacterium]|nr:S8 family serine peptidase [Candidatus Eisenbacteria bacterium]